MGKDYLLGLIFLKGDQFADQNVDYVYYMYVLNCYRYHSSAMLRNNIAVRVVCMLPQ